MGVHPKYPPDKHSEFKQLCDEYFDVCDRDERPYTIPGLAYHLGFESRQSILDYKGKPNFSCTIKRARARIEQQRVESLVAGKGSAPGQIFDLKNNFGYKDKTETALTGAEGGPIEVSQTKFIFIDVVEHKNIEVSQEPENKTKRLKSPPDGDKQAKAKPKSKPKKLRKTAK